MPKAKLFIPAVIWFLIIFILLVMPGKDIPTFPFLDAIYFDKWVHAGLFGMLVLLTSFPFFRSQYGSARLFFTIALCATLYGVIMEFVQKYCTADRDFEVLDMAADAFGALVGFAWMNMRYNRFLRKHPEAVPKK